MLDIKNQYLQIQTSFHFPVHCTDLPMHIVSENLFKLVSCILMRFDNVSGEISGNSIHLVCHTWKNWNVNSVCDIRNSTFVNIHLPSAFNICKRQRYYPGYIWVNTDNVLVHLSVFVWSSLIDWAMITVHLYFRIYLGSTITTNHEVHRHCWGAWPNIK